MSKYIKFILCIIICVLVLGTSIFLKNNNFASRNVVMSYKNLMEKPWEVKLKKASIKMFDKMKKNMVLDKVYNNKRIDIFYGASISVTEYFEDYYETFLFAGDKINYIKYKNIDISIGKDNNLTENEIIEASLYSVDDKYFDYFLEIYEQNK